MDPENHFELVQLVGVGTFGCVWKALDKRGGGTVAVKILSLEEDSTELEQEIDILKRCDSELIVDYLGTYEKRDACWIVMEYCEGGSVVDLMNYCGITLEEDAIQHIVAFTLLGLEYLHAQNLIHRDIKAGNILLTEAGQSKLADFGVAARLTTMHSKRQTVTGAPFWMAPEVISAETRYGNQADIWSLGITVIEMAQGKPPHHNVHPLRVVFVIPSRPPPKLDAPKHWSPAMNDFVASCLVKDADARPSASELLAHPFVAGTLSTLAENDLYSNVLKKLVRDHMPDIEAARMERHADHSEGSSA